MADCLPVDAPLWLDPMKNGEWQRRLKAAGLNQRDLAQLAGLSANAVSEALTGKLKGGVPRYLRVIIQLWEIADRTKRDGVMEPDEPPST